MYDKIITIRLPKPVFRQAKALAEQREISLSSFLREALIEKLLQSLAMPYDAESEQEYRAWKTLTDEDV